MSVLGEKLMVNQGETKKYVLKKCLTCKKVFNSYLGVQKYCSRSCRNKDYRIKLKSNPETYAERLDYIKNWRKTHPEKVKEIRKRAIERRRLRRKELRGIPEKVLRGKIKEKDPRIIDLDAIHPDFYDPQEDLFVEVKVASKNPNVLFSNKSKHFDGLFFSNHSSSKYSVDNQIKKYPRPLLVIVFDVYTGEELTRKKFT